MTTLCGLRTTERTTPVAGDIQNATYAYNHDGLLGGVDNTAVPEFDQTNKYDFAGRLKKNSVGNGYVFSQTMNYDAFNNLTMRRNDFNGNVDEFQAFYTNNIKTGSTVPVNDVYDGAGNVVHSVFSPHTERHSALQ